MRDGGVEIELVSRSLWMMCGAGGNDMRGTFC